MSIIKEILKNEPLAYRWLAAAAIREAYMLIDLWPYNRQWLRDYEENLIVANPKQKLNEGSHAQIGNDYLVMLWNIIKGIKSLENFKRFRLSSLFRNLRSIDSVNKLESKKQYAIFKCITGKKIQVEGLEWNGRAIVNYAQAIKQQRRWKECAILADLLEEAGNTDEKILNHLRQDKHWFGCHIVESILT